MSDKKKRDILSLMMLAQEEGQAMTDEIIRDNVFTFMVGGFETTSTALSWTLYALSIVRKIGFLNFYKAKPVSHNNEEKMWKSLG